MKISAWLLVAVISVASTAVARPGGQSSARHAERNTVQQSKTRLATSVNQDYILALAAANQFLYAWSTRNQDEGWAVISARLKDKFPEEYLRSYISGISNPHHQAFEVGRGQRLPSGAFAFPVVMYEHYSGQKETIEHPKSLRIVVVQAGPESWSVDELPGFVSPEPK